MTNREILHGPDEAMKNGCTVLLEFEKELRAYQMGWTE